MSKTAFLVLDLQNGILERVKDTANLESYLSRASNAIQASRAAGIPVIYVKTSFRPGHPEVSARNALSARIVTYGGFVEGSGPDVEISSAVAPQPERDIVVTKRRVSAFSGSDLDCILRGLGVDSLVVAGIATSGAVLSTVRQAADLDYSLTVVSDLCLCTDEEVHRVLIEKVFPRQATVVSAEQWIKEISATKE